MKYIGNVPATKGVICELSWEEWRALLEISGVKEGDYLDEEAHHPPMTAQQRRMLLGLLARAVRASEPCPWFVAEAGWSREIAEKMVELVKRDWSPCPTCG